MHIYTHTHAHACIRSVYTYTCRVYKNCANGKLHIMYVHIYVSPTLLLSSHSLPSPLILPSPPLPSPPFPSHPRIYKGCRNYCTGTQDYTWMEHQWSAGVAQTASRVSSKHLSVACMQFQLPCTCMWIHRLSIPTDNVQAWEHETLSSTNHACSCGASMLYSHCRVFSPNCILHTAMTRMIIAVLERWSFTWIPMVYSCVRLSR